MSKRTVIRWERGDHSVDIGTLRRVAALLRAHHPALAAQLESAAQQYADTIGWDPAQPARQPPALPNPSIALVLDAAASTTQVPRPTMRLALHAALSQAKVLGLSVDALLEALDEPA